MKVSHSNNLNDIEILDLCEDISEEMAAKICGGSSGQMQTTQVLMKLISNSHFDRVVRSQTE